MVPPAARMRVTTVASQSATNPSKTRDPLRRGNPRTDVLSLMPTDLPASSPLPEPVIGPSQAHAPNGFSAAVGARPGGRGDISAPGITGSGIASSCCIASTDLSRAARIVVAMSVLSGGRPRRCAPSCRSRTVGPENATAQAAFVACDGTAAAQATTSSVVMTSANSVTMLTSVALCSASVKAPLPSLTKITR